MQDNILVGRLWSRLKISKALSKIHLALRRNKCERLILRRPRLAIVNAPCETNLPFRARKKCNKDKGSCSCLRALRRISAFAVTAERKPYLGSERLPRMALIWAYGGLETSAHHHHHHHCHHLLPHLTQ